ncbi:MAG: SMP-30/gluconolactonase/LRE family protein [Gemmatimonadaceae bacterium]
MSQSLALRRTAPAALVVAAFIVAGCHNGPPAPIAPASPVVTTVAASGFNQPENLVYDSIGDVYLVSNMGGGDAARDDNGFISRVAPDGHVIALRWIAGGVNGATLDAPKGLAIRGDTLAVADIGGVHYFSRSTGAPLGSVALPGVVMNDLAFAPDGTLWITDTGPDRGTTPIDTSKDMDAVWTVSPGGAVSAVARGLALGRPDGLVLDGNGALVATFGVNRIERVAPGMSGATTFATLPGGRVDGLRRLGDGSLLVTSWDAKTVWRLPRAGPPVALLTAVTSPAGVAVDTRRNQLAVTSMQSNTMYLLPLR